MPATAAIDNETLDHLLSVVTGAFKVGQIRPLSKPWPLDFDTCVPAASEIRPPPFVAAAFDAREPAAQRIERHDDAEPHQINAGQTLALTGRSSNVGVEEPPALAYRQQPSRCRSAFETRNNNGRPSLAPRPVAARRHSLRRIDGAGADLSGPSGAGCHRVCRGQRTGHSGAHGRAGT